MRPQPGYSPDQSLMRVLLDQGVRSLRMDDLAAAKESAWREVAAIDDAHARGEIDDAGWHRGMATLVVPAYLGAPDVRGGSGHTGSAEDWAWSRGVVTNAIDRSGTSLDVGCANGLLMESVVSWALAAQPYDRSLRPRHRARAGGGGSPRSERRSGPGAVTCTVR